MVKLITICLFLLITIAYVAALSSSCPPSSKMTSCSPKCKDDHDCLGQKCCPNICNAKSCTAANQLSNDDHGYKGGSSSATGTYCGNVKCNSYEKCELDRSTKRQKCICEHNLAKKDFRFKPFLLELNGKVVKMRNIQ